MYTPNDKRYDNMIYSRCGKSGLKLPKISLGFWQNFGYRSDFANMEEMVHTAFDLGITHFDLANNYGNPYNGSAEENFGRILDVGCVRFVMKCASPQKQAMRCGTDLTATVTVPANI